jgi:hypothetical protein
VDFTLSIILYCDLTATLFMCRCLSNQVKHKLVIDLNIWHSHCNLLIESATNLLEDLSDSSRDQTSILIILSRPRHGKGLSSTSLSIAHHSTVISFNHSLYNISRTIVKHLLLTCIMKYLIEFELPLFLLVVNETSTFILRNLESNSLYGYRVSKS